MNVSVTVYQPRPPGRAAAWNRPGHGRSAGAVSFRFLRTYVCGNWQPNGTWISIGNAFAAVSTEIMDSEKQCHLRPPVSH